MIGADKPLNILFLASWYPNRIEPQNGNFIQRHAVAVAKNCRVACLHVLSVANVQGFEVTAAWKDGVYEVIVYFEKTVAYLPFRKVNKYLKAHRLGYEQILKEFGKIDLVHLNVFLRAGLFALWLRQKYQIPFIITEHWTAFLSINPYAFNWLEKRYIKKIGQAAAMICPVSEDLKKAIQHTGINGPFKVIPNVVDTQLFQTAPRDFSMIKILHVSTLMDQHKNVSGFLRVIRKLQDERQDFKVTLAGNKVGDIHFKTLDKLGITAGTVDILEEIPIDSIAALMQEYHIFVLFSNYENLPCVISEAHASGMVVIATDVGGVREMINPENGYLIPAKNEDELLVSLKLVMDKLNTYDSQKIRAAAIDRYSYQSVADAYLEVYQTVLNPA